MPEHGGAGDDDEDHAGDPRGLVQRAHEPAPGEVAPDQRDQERPEGADGRRFRGREKAHEQSPHDHEEEDEGFDDARKGGCPFFPGRFRRLFTDLRLEFCPDQDRHDKEHGQEDTGQDARHEELSDRLLGHDAVDDENGAGRDKDAQTSPRGDDACGQCRVVVVFLHFRQGHGGHRRCCGAGGAADGGEPGAGPDGGDGQAAGKMPQKLVGRVEKTAAHAGMVGHLTHEDEQRNDGQVVGAEHREKIAGNQVQGSIPGNEQAEAGKTHKGHDEAHRDLEEHESHEDDEAQEAHRGRRHHSFPRSFRFFTTFRIP